MACSHRRLQPRLGPSGVVVSPLIKSINECAGTEWTAPRTTPPLASSFGPAIGTTWKWDRLSRSRLGFPRLLRLCRCGGRCCRDHQLQRHCDSSSASGDSVRIYLVFPSFKYRWQLLILRDTPIGDGMALPVPQAGKRRWRAWMEAGRGMPRPGDGLISVGREIIKCGVKVC